MGVRACQTRSIGASTLNPEQVFLEIPAAARARLAVTLGKIADLKSKDAARASSSAPLSPGPEVEPGKLLSIKY